MQTGQVRWKTIAVVALVLGMTSLAFAEIPQVISYQGKMTDTSGSPVADGTYTMRFRIYDTVTVGTLKWDSGAQSVTVAGGIFSVLLGESPQPALTLDFSQDYWLLVTFNAVDQTPRQRLASTGYAYMASGLVAGTEVSGSVTSGTASAIKGTNTATSGGAYGLYGQSASTGGCGTVGIATATTGQTTGGWFQTESSTSMSRSIIGWARGTTGGTYAGWFQTDSNAGIGAYGYATANSGETRGVSGLSASSAGRGVMGEATATSGITFGVYGTTAAPGGRGVYGEATMTTGTTYGAYGKSASIDGRGVYGLATATSGTTYGVYGHSNSVFGTGVFGSASATSGATFGGKFFSDSSGGRGVYGEASAATGDTYGGRCESASTSGRGIYGYATASSGITYGVYGRSESSSGYGVYYQGGMGGTGPMRVIVRTSQGPTGLGLHATAGDWFEDFGEGQLVNGRCHIELDPLFLETVTIDAANPMKVFVQLGDDSRGVFVRKEASGFDVVETLGGTASIPFDYRVIAKRKGFEAKRLDVCEAARTDSYLYPELREKELQEREAERARMEEEGARMRQDQDRMARVGAE